MKPYKIILFLICCSCLVQQEIIAQCDTEAHSTNWKDAWTSCQTSTNPNPSRGTSHWIKYDFGYVYHLKQSHIWNANETGQTNKGLKDVIIDYSIDGTTWVNLGTFQFLEASGMNDYTGFVGPDFGGINARYVLITATNNWGGSCYSLAEVKFELGEVVLPVEAIAYDVVCQKNTENAVEITWLIDQTADTDFFKIERSIDGQTWETIAKVQAKNHRKKYAYIDHDYYKGASYYQLSDIARDGTSSSFGVQSVECIAALSFGIAPNPFLENTNIEIYSEHHESIRYTITDVLGKMVLENTIYPQYPTTLISDIGQGLNAGTYTLSIRQGEHTKTQQFVKIDR